MRHYLLFIPFCVGLIACGKDNPNSNESSSVQDTDIRVLYLANADGQTPEAPRIITNYGEWSSIALVSDSSNQGYVAIQFINGIKDENYLLIADQDNVFMFPNNPKNKTIDNEFLFFFFKDKYMYAGSGELNWSNGDYDILEIEAFDIGDDDEVISKSANAYSTKGNGEDPRELIWKHISKAGKGAKKIKDMLPEGKYTQSAKDVCSFWSESAMVAFRYGLYVDKPQMQDQIRDEFAMEGGKKILLKIKPLKKAYSMYKGAKQILNKVKGFFNSSDDDSEDENVEPIRSVFSRAIRDIDMVPIHSDFSGRMPLSYKVTINADINQSSATATISADIETISYSSGFVSSYGFEYGPLAGKKETKEVDKFPASLTLTNLEDGVTYIVTAYANSMGIRYSKSVSFKIGDKFSASPSELSFTQNGGSKGVYLEIPDNWKWDISSCPKWCTIEKGDRAFFVDVASTDKERSGEILIRGYSDTTDKQCKITIVQMVVNWDNTSWNVKGTYKWSDSSKTWPLEYEVTFRNISSSYTESGYKYYINEQGQAVREYEESNPYYPSLKHVEIETYTRTSPTTAIMVATGYEQNPNPFTGEAITRELHGEYQCTIINSNL